MLMALVQSLFAGNSSVRAPLRKLLFYKNIVGNANNTR